MDLIKGQIYKVSHSRKGTFSLLVNEQDETWVSGVIVKGEAKAILKYNEVEQGEDITIRKEFCSFQPINK